MGLTGKIFSLCLLTLVFIAPICAESLSDNEETAVNEELSLIEEPPKDKDSPPSDDFFFDEDFFDDDSFVFNAPTLIFEVPFFETRFFDEIFPDLSQNQKNIVMSRTGLRHAFDKDGSPTFTPDPDSGIDLLSGVMLKKPSHIIEALIVVPYNKRELDILDIYNALRNIKNIQDHTITVRGKEYKFFQDTTRLESAQNRKPISDPPHTDVLPYLETMYLRFVDQYMGDLYIRGEISINLFGITYSLTNFRDVSYSIFRIMKAEKFIAVIYLEPVKEGILIYSMSGLYIPNFVSHRVNLTSSMNYRITTLINWITDGLRKEENNNKSTHFYLLYRE